MPSEEDTGRRLSQAPTGSPPPPQAPRSAPAPAKAPPVFDLQPADVTEVSTAQDLLTAVANGALDIEIRVHIDLRDYHVRSWPVAAEDWEDLKHWMRSRFCALIEVSGRYGCDIFGLRRYMTTVWGCMVHCSVSILQLKYVSGGKHDSGVYQQPEIALRSMQESEYIVLLRFLAVQIQATHPLTSWGTACMFVHPEISLHTLSAVQGKCNGRQEQWAENYLTSVRPRSFPFATFCHSAPRCWTYPVGIRV